MHYLNGTGLCCAPPTCIVHHWLSMNFVETGDNEAGFFFLNLASIVFEEDLGRFLGKGPECRNHADRHMQYSQIMTI